MRQKLFPATAWVWVAAALAGLAGPGTLGRAAEMKLQAQLVWGSDDSKPPEGKNYQPVEPEISKRLKELRKMPTGGQSRRGFQFGGFVEQQGQGSDETEAALAAR